MKEILERFKKQQNYTTGQAESGSFSSCPTSPMGSWKKWPWQEWRLSRAQQCGLSVTNADLPLDSLSAQSARGQHCMSDWVPFHRVISKSPSGRWLHWTASIMEEAALLLLELTLTLDTDLPSLHAMLQAKLPSVDLQNALSTIMVFHKALLLIKGLTLEQMKHGNRPIFMKLTGLTKFPPVLKLVTWQNGGMAYWSSVTAPAGW